ncbi:MAG: PorT family protein [candidate division Zixibacteria bacterium]|nr:PorT family protein [candidate division Zixibacteria bacterium]
MKKLVITLGLVLVFAMSASAQDEGVGLTAKGFKVGLNMANVSGDDVEGTDSKMGIVGGLFFTYNFSSTFALQPEILYTMKGCTMTEEGVDVDVKVDYIEIPVLFKFTFGQGTTKPCFFAGPAMAFLMSAKMEAMGLSVDFKDETKSMDLGIVFGGGVDFAMGNGTMTFDGRYTMGMSSIDDTEYDEDIKNGVISFMVGYGF